MNAIDTEATTLKRIHDIAYKHATEVAMKSCHLTPDIAYGYALQGLLIANAVTNAFTSMEMPLHRASFAIVGTLAGLRNFVETLDSKSELVQFLSKKKTPDGEA